MDFDKTKKRGLNKKLVGIKIRKKGIDIIINIRKLMLTKRSYIESVLKVDYFV